MPNATINYSSDFNLTEILRHKLKHMPGYRFKEEQTFNLSERPQRQRSTASGTIPFLSSILRYSCNQTLSPIEHYLNQNLFFSVAAALSTDMSRFSARSTKRICIPCSIMVFKEMLSHSTCAFYAGVA